MFGYIHLDKIAIAVKAGIRTTREIPIKFFTIGIYDGITMNHLGMKYSLVDRELIAGSIETMSIVFPF